MGLFNKLKDILFEDEEVEEKEIKVKEEKIGRASCRERV